VVTVLVIVAKANPSPGWFKFNLKFSGIKVKVHTNNVLETLVGQKRIPNNMGWLFKIRGNFNSDVAKEAVDSEGATVGLNSVGLSNLGAKPLGRS
jgi:hypothetical protein